MCCGISLLRLTSGLHIYRIPLVEVARLTQISKQSLAARVGVNLPSSVEDSKQRLSCFVATVSTALCCNFGHLCWRNWNRNYNPIQSLYAQVFRHWLWCFRSPYHVIYIFCVWSSPNQDAWNVRIYTFENTFFLFDITEMIYHIRLKSMECETAEAYHRSKYWNIQ